MSLLKAFQPAPFGTTTRSDINLSLKTVHKMIPGRLPTSLVSLLKKFNGASVRFNREVRYRPVVRSPWAQEDGTQTLTALFGISDKKKGLPAMISQYEGRMPEGVVPIGEGPGGNLICFVASGQKKGRIMFWDHEDERNISGDEENDYGNMYLVANSYREFLELLCEVDEEPPSTDGIVDIWLADDL